MTPAWVPCPYGCGEYWCTLHHSHVYDCVCPPIEEWESSPYEVSNDSDAG